MAFSLLYSPTLSLFPKVELHTDAPQKLNSPQQANPLHVESMRRIDGVIMSHSRDPESHIFHLKCTLRSAWSSSLCGFRWRWSWGILGSWWFLVMEPTQRGSWITPPFSASTRWEKHVVHMSSHSIHENCPLTRLVSVCCSQDNIIVVKDATSHPMSIVSSTKSRWALTCYLLVCWNALELWKMHVKVQTQMKLRDSNQSCICRFFSRWKTVQKLNERAGAKNTTSHIRPQQNLPACMPSYLRLVAFRERESDNSWKSHVCVQYSDGSGDCQDLIH